jgi:hypothetical protein
MNEVVIKTIFMFLSFCKSLQDNSLQLPCQKPLDGSQTLYVQHLILEDEVFEVSDNLLGPFDEYHHTIKTREFN